MAGSGPVAPFLATAPLNAAPPRRRRWVRPVSIVSAVAVAAVLAALLSVPVKGSATTELTLVNSGGVGWVGQTVAFAHPGTLELSWKVTQGGTVSFRMLAPSGMSVYAPSSASSGSITLPVVADGPYTVEIQDLFAATVTVSATLHYSAPPL